MAASVLALIARGVVHRYRPRIVMVTAYGREDVMRLSEQAGADGFLIKPVSPSTLLDTLLSVLGRGRVLGPDSNPDGSPPRPVASLLSRGQLVGARLLLVEDNDINREFACELLRSEGMDVDEAVDGQEAIARVQQQAYDAVLMDIQMPVMDGLEATRRIRALADAPGGERFANLPIIAMTALAMAQDAEQSQAAGMNDHVTKPVAPERLMAALLKWVHLPADRVITFQPTAKAIVTAPEFPPDLLALSSLDTPEGVRRIGGKAQAYRKQLRRFREHYADAASHLQRLVAAQDQSAAEDYSHALKGVTGNLGAVALYAKVTDINLQLKQGAMPSDADLDAMRTLLLQVIADIDSLATPLPAPVAASSPLSAGEIMARLTQLAHALEYDLGVAEGLLTHLRSGVVGHAIEPAIGEIAARADVFAIDEALALVTALIAHLTSAPDIRNLTETRP